MNDHVKLKRGLPTRENIMDLMARMYERKEDAYLYFEKELEFNWVDICVECNVRNWLRQRQYYFGWIQK